MRERLETSVLLHEMGEHLRSIAVLGSAAQEVREAFDLLPTETEADWATIAARMARVPECLGTLQAAYTEGIVQGLVAARRQVVGTIQQVEVWAGTDAAGTRPYFQALADRLEESGVGGSSLATTVRDRAEHATAALDAFARYLTSEYSPHADERDPVGEERYAIKARVWNGTTLDLARDLPVGLGRAAPHRARDRSGRGADPAGLVRRRGDRAARDGSRARSRARTTCGRGSRTSWTARSAS